MIVDIKSRPWILASVGVFAIATVLYVPYAHGSARGPHGGTWLGLGYGVGGSALMLFALLLGARKRVRTARVGKAYYWMQGHVWLGLLSYPLILYHAGFSWGGTLTQVIMWMFTVVVVSGIVGLILQQYVPTKMLREVPAETIYAQMNHVLRQLREEAKTIVETAEARTGQEAYDLEVVPAGGATAVAAAAAPGTGTAAMRLRTFYAEQVLPVLADRFPQQAPLAAEATAPGLFREIRGVLPADMHEAVADLQSIVDERRQLERQRRLHHLLHFWLLFHVPLSYALVILAAVHAVYALRYSSIGG